MKLFVSTLLFGYLGVVVAASEDKQVSTQDEKHLRRRQLQTAGEFYIVNPEKNKVIDVSGGRCARRTSEFALYLHVLFAPFEVASIFSNLS